MAIYKYLNDKGLIIPDIEDVQNQVEQEFKNIFGEDFDVSSKTPQGVIITAIIEAITEVINTSAEEKNQFNPNYAGGIYLDGIGALTAAKREEKKYSQVPVNLSGVPGTVIPVGARLRSQLGYIFKSRDEVTLDNLGQAQIIFVCVTAGNIICPAGTLTEILPLENGEVIFGWETAINPSDATPGKFEESDVSFRNTRRQTLAIQGNYTLDAIISNVYVQRDVESVRGLENYESTAQTKNGILLAPNSIWIAVYKGDDNDIARAIVSRKPPGTNYTANYGTPITVTIIDPISQENIVVKFSRPTEIPIVARVTISVDATVIDPVSAVKQAILDYANGEIENETGFEIGSSVSPFELAGAIKCENPAITIHKVEVSKLSTINYSTAEIPLNIYEIATVQASSITVILQ